MKLNYTLVCSFHLGKLHKFDIIQGRIQDFQLGGEGTHRQPIGAGRHAQFLSKIKQNPHENEENFGRWKWGGGGGVPPKSANVIC